MRHPDHERLVKVIPEWYTRSSPDMGYIVERRPFGFCVVNRGSPRLTCSAIVRDLMARDAPGFLRDMRAHFGNHPIRITVDDRRLEADVGTALVAAGCARGSSQVYLAHVGPVPEGAAVRGLTIEPVTAAENLLDYAITKLKGFADTEAQPQPEAVQSQMALRKMELAGEGRFLLGRLDREPAAVIAWYEGEDRLLFHLATRVPFRRRGIAKQLLRHVLAESYARGCRSIILFTDPDDTPIWLYRRLGFIDEVYWRQHYVLNDSST